MARQIASDENEVDFVSRVWNGLIFKIVMFVVITILKIFKVQQLETREELQRKYSSSFKHEACFHILRKMNRYNPDILNGYQVPKELSYKTINASQQHGSPYSSLETSSNPHPNTGGFPSSNSNLNGNENLNRPDEVGVKREKRNRNASQDPEKSSTS